MLTKEIILSKYPKYSSIQEITKLNIWGEDIEDISILSKMPNLEILSLSSNKISSLYPLSNCLNMREIYLRNNNIYSFEELYHLKNLPKLKVLWLEGNPITKEQFYTEKVLNILPKLHNLDNKNISPYKNIRQKGQSEEQKLLKNQCDLNANIIKSSRKKLLLRRMFSYCEASNDNGIIETSNDISLGQNKMKNDNSHIKKIDLTEFKIKFTTKGKSARKERKNFKKIKLKIKDNNKYNFNFCNNYMLYNYIGSGLRISNKKLTVDTNPNSKPTKRDNITVQNSIIQQNNSDLKEQNTLKNKKFFFGNKNLYNNIYNYKSDDKISININKYEDNNNSNNNNNLMQAIYLLIDKMKIQDLLYLKEYVNKKISILNK